MTDKLNYIEYHIINETGLQASIKMQTDKTRYESNTQLHAVYKKCVLNIKRQIGRKNRKRYMLTPDRRLLRRNGSINIKVAFTAKQFPAINKVMS